MNNPGRTMQLVPCDKMLERVERYGSDSDVVLLQELLYAGELFVKATVSAFIAAVQDDRENHRYRIAHKLVRADGIGEWVQALDELLTGSATQNLAKEFYDIRRVFTERVDKNSWQYDCVRSLHAALSVVNVDIQPMGDRIALRAWFQWFAELRNKTRGHGAPTPSSCSAIVIHLDPAIKSLKANNPVFGLPWAHLHRNLSGRYRISPLGGDKSVFTPLGTSSSSTSSNLIDGIYIHIGDYRRVELMHTDADVSDFFVPNGAFRDSSYELHSLITDSRQRGDASPYLAHSGSRPKSETEGAGQLEVRGNVWTNAPTIAPNYIRRPKIEAEIYKLLMDDRHPIVTLLGRGGIGKTSIALATLQDL